MQLKKRILIYLFFIANLNIVAQTAEQQKFTTDLDNFVEKKMKDFSSFAQENEESSSNLIENNSISKIEVILNEMDRLKKEREEIILRNNGSVSKDEELKRLTVIDSEIDKLKKTLKVLKEKTK